mgnify:FL=1
MAPAGLREPIREAECRDFARWIALAYVCVRLHRVSGTPQIFRQISFNSEWPQSWEAGDSAKHTPARMASPHSSTVKYVPSTTPARQDELGVRFTLGAAF